MQNSKKHLSVIFVILFILVSFRAELRGESQAETQNVDSLTIVENKDDSLLHNKHQSPHELEGNYEYVDYMFRIDSANHLTSIELLKPRIFISPNVPCHTCSTDSNILRPRILIAPNSSCDECAA